MLVFVTDRWTDGQKIIEGEIADRLIQIHTFIHTYINTHTECKYNIKI